MKKEEHIKILDNIKNATSDADRMKYIVELSTDYTSVLAEKETLSEQYKQANEDATKFAKLNNELWLANSVQEQAGQATTTIETEVEVLPKRTYEELENKF